MEILTLLVVTAGLMPVTWTMITSFFQGVYVAEDDLYKELMSNKELSKTLLQIEDPHERIKIHFTKFDKRGSMPKWRTIGELRKAMFDAKHSQATKPLRDVYIYFTRVLSLSERIHYAFTPPKRIRFTYWLVGFSGKKYIQEEAWIRSLIYPFADHPIFLLALADYYGTGYQEKDLCTLEQQIVSDKYRDIKRTDLINIIFPEFDKVCK